MGQVRIAPRVRGVGDAAAGGRQIGSALLQEGHVHISSAHGPLRPGCRSVGMGFFERTTRG
jgi:hypothetical protein